MLYLGIDSGTQSTKCIVLDLENGDILTSASASYELIDGLPPGHLEQHPADWISALDTAVQGCLVKIGDRKAEVRGIGVSGQQHGLVVLDAKDQVVRPAKLWCDTSTVDQCAQFDAAFGGKSGLIELAGNAMLPGYTAPKILWLKQNEPQHFAAVRSVLLPHDYLNFYLTGEKTMEYGDASGTGLLNLKTREWCTPLIDFIDPALREWLPPVTSSSKPAGKLRSGLADAWELEGEVIVSAGGGDNMMGAIGTGNTKPGVVTASFGTSGTLYCYAENPVIDPQGEIAAFCDSTGAWMPLVCTMNVTVATEQVRELFGWTIEQLQSAVDATAAGSNGVLFLPYLNGERTPNLPSGTGVFHGLTTANMLPGPMARAVIEGATLGLAYGLKRFRDLGITAKEIRLTGGGSRSAVWRQLAADVFGAETVCLSSSEGAALGAAVQAAWAHAGGSVTLESLSNRLVKLDESTRCFPDPSRTTLYADLLEKHTSLTRALHEKGWL